MNAPGSRWVVYACRTAYAAEVAEIVWRTGGEIAALVDNLPQPEPVTNALGPVVSLDQLDDDLRSCQVVIPLLTPGHRWALADQARTHGFTSFPSLVDPTSVVARSSEMSEGTVVNAGAVVGAMSRVGCFVHVNRSASIGHDADIRDYATLGPGCILAGHVTVHRGAFIGAGATCAPQVTVGANSIVGAGAVVVNDVPEGAVVVGNPAKVLRQSSTGYGGVAVPAR